jgi:beta-phosphoglucomutase
MIKAIIFDMDGVLVEAKDWHFEALNRALGEYGYAISREDHERIYDGLPTRKKLEILSEKTPLLHELHQVIYDKKQVYTLELVEMYCKPNPVHHQALSGLLALGYRLGLASNSMRISVDLMMQKTDLDRYLDLKLSNEDVDKPKPDPEMYQRAMVYFGVTPRECLIIEDNPVGIRAAVASDAHLMTVREVDEVNLENIVSYIKKLEKSRL